MVSNLAKIDTIPIRYANLMVIKGRMVITRDIIKGNEGGTELLHFPTNYVALQVQLVERIFDKI